MSGGSNTDTGHVIGASTTAIAGAVGVNVLPDTGGYTLIQIISFAALILGGAVALTSIALIIARRKFGHGTKA